FQPAMNFAAGSGPFSIAVGDVNGDQLPDLVTPNSTGNDVTVLLNGPSTQAPAITSGNATTFVVGPAGTFSVTTTGVPAPALTETGTLPAGVTFVDNGNGTATLSGTPAANTGGTYPITVTASNSVGTAATQTFTLTVNQAPALTSANAT